MHTAGAKALGWDLVHRLGVVEEPVELMQSEGVGDGEPWQPSTCTGDLRELLRVPLRSQAYCGLGRRSRNSTGLGAMAKVLISS